MEISCFIFDIDQKDRWPAETAGPPIPDTEDGQIQK